MSVTVSALSKPHSRARVLTRLVVASALVAMVGAGCSGMPFGPAYPTDEVDRFHAMARNIQADTSGVAISLSTLRIRLQGVAAGEPSGSVREVAMMVKEVRSAGQRLAGAVGTAGQLFTSGEKIVKTAPQHYSGPMASHLPRKQELLMEAMTWLGDLPNTGSELVLQTTALTLCATDLLDNAAAPRCHESGLADVLVAAPPPAQNIVVALETKDLNEQAVAEVSVPAGETVNFAGLVRDQYGNPVNAPLAWEVVAGGGTIDARGQFTASVVAGSYARTVTATAAGIEAQYTVHVLPGAAHAVSYISPTNAQLKPGHRIRFSAEVTDSHGNITGDQVKWSVRGGVGKITPDEVQANVAEFIAGKSPGEYTKSVQATFGDAVSTANILIVVGPVARIEVKPGSTKVPVNGARRFSAVPYDDEGNVVASEVTWQVTQSSRARISDRGMLMIGCDVVVGDYPGLVIALSGGVVQPVDVQVLPGRAVSMKLSEREVDLPTSGQVQLEAVAVDACGNTPLAPVAWSLPMGGGTITQTGEFHAARRTGSFPIVARSGSVVAQTQVNVQPGQAASIVIAPDDLVEPITSEAPGEETDAGAVSTAPPDAPTTVLAEDGEGVQVSESKDAETPGEALTKAAPVKTPPGRFLNFVEGASQSGRPTDDLYEPLPSGTAADFLRRGYEIIHDDRVEYFVDQEGKIYEDRPYQGVVPGRRLNADGTTALAPRDVNTVTWVGFQPMAAMSRVFWQMTNPEPSFEVRRIEPTRIEVTLHDTKAANQNAMREMVMELFTGPIRSVRGVRSGSGLKYIIELKNSAHYLYRYEAPYLLLDFEVDADF
jgi:hypothetical protein